MAIADIHEDIIQTHILTRLNGQTLISAGCSSSQFHFLCSDDKLWSDICTSSWPSTQNPLVTQAISNFTSGHRSFFSDAFPSPSGRRTTMTSLPQTPQIISSVDLRFHDQLVFSKAESTNTSPTDWFQTSPFRIDLLEPKELAVSPVNFSDVDQVLQTTLENHMALSWILIDPTRNRAVNLSSVKPVSVQRNWLTDEIELTFSVITVGDDFQRDYDHVNCNVEVTCGVNGGNGELYVSGVSLTVQDIDGKCLSGKDSMVILQGLMVAERRRRGGEEVERKRYVEYLRRRRERKEEMERRERLLDLACVASGVTFLMAFWSFALLLN